MTAVDNAERYDIGDLADGTTGEWSDGDVKITCDTDYWGFTVHLNRHAFTKLVVHTKEFLALAKAVLPTPVNLIVILHVAVRIGWAKAIDQGTGISFYSPWLVPGWLQPSAWYDGEGERPKPPPPPGDTALWFTVYDPEHGWSADQLIPGLGTESGPSSLTGPAVALSGSGKSFRVVYRGGPGDTRLRVTTCYTNPDSKMEWGKELISSNLRSELSPAISICPGWRSRMIVFRGAGDDNQLYYLHTDEDNGEFTWGQARPVPGVRTEHDPAVHIHLREATISYTKAGDDQARGYRIHGTYNDGTWTWGEPQSFDHGLHHGVSMGDTNTVGSFSSAYCVAGGSLRAYEGTFGQGVWPKPIGEATSVAPPAVTRSPSEDKLVLAVFRGPEGDQTLYYSESHRDENNPWGPVQKMGNKFSHSRPGLHWGTYVKDGQEKRQVLCVHRGNGPN
jgi:hypothetical protein